MSDPPSVDVETAVGVTVVFGMAVIIALVVTVVSAPAGVQILAVTSVVPMIVLGLVFIFYGRRKRLWAFAGASVLGAVGVCFRVAVSTRPSLEVGGGLPVGVSMLYIVLGAVVSLKNYEAVLELRSIRNRARAASDPSQ